MSPQNTNRMITNVQVTDKVEALIAWIIEIIFDFPVWIMNEYELVMGKVEEIA